MTRTFLVAIDLEPTSDVDSIAADIQDSLVQDGFPVTSVKPWASATTQPADLFPDLPTISGKHGPAFPPNFLG